MNATGSLKKYSVDFTYRTKGSKREIYKTVVTEANNVEEIAIKLARMYNDVIIKEYKVVW